MNKSLVLLMGEQPAPNLLPSLYYQPQIAIIVHTERTYKFAKNLKKILEANMQCLLCDVEPYNIQKIRKRIAKFLYENVSGYSLIFNLTGGTKPMAMAAFELAKNKDCPFVYFQTEGNRSLLYCYSFKDNNVVLDEEIEIHQSIELKEQGDAAGSYNT